MNQRVKSKLILNSLKQEEVMKEKFIKAIVSYNDLVTRIELLIKRNLEGILLYSTVNTRKTIN